MPELVRPDIRYRESFRAAHAEWAGAHQDGSGVTPEVDVVSDDGFAAFVAGLLRAEHTPKGEGYVTCTFLWVVEGDEYLGAIALRHELNAYLADRGGHVGYGVRPSARRRGIATFALRSILPVAGARGLARVLVTCDDDNEGSWRTIERCGGVLEDVRTGDDGVAYRRYWVPTGASSA